MIKFECTADTVSRALNYKSFTLKSEAIRQYAIDYYEGKLIIQNVRAKKVKSTKKQKNNEGRLHRKKTIISEKSAEIEDIENCFLKHREKLLWIHRILRSI